MIYYLQKAIMDRFNSSAGDTLRGLVQGLWEDLAPSSLILGTQAGQELENSVLPFMTFTIVTTGLEQNFCANMWEPIVQFVIFGDANNKSSIALLEAGEEFLNVFGDENLPMDGDYTMVRSDTTDQRKFIDDQKMWNVVYEISYIVYKDR